MSEGATTDVVLDRSDPAGVRRGRHRRTGRNVVLKQADPTGAVDRAADLLLAADHPGILSVLDHHRGQAVLTPQLSCSLAELLAARPALGPAATAQLLLEACDALHHLHRRGLVHGDLSPGNVLLHADGQPVLADPATHPLQATAAYVAPEVAAGQACTVAGDLHALAVIGLECLGGAEASDHAPLRSVLVRAASPEPDDRPADAAVLARLVADAVPGTTWLDRVPGRTERQADPAVAAPSTRTFGPPRPTPDRPGAPAARPHLRIVVRAVLALAAVVLAAVVTGAALRAGKATCPDLTAAGDPAEVMGDLDGDGCLEALRWEPAEAVVELPGGRRLQVGEAGDQLLLGDWDCDGVDTPALYRPSTGEVFEFARWVSGDGALTSSETRQTGVRDGTPTVVAPTGAGCDRVAVDPPHPTP